MGLAVRAEIAGFLLGRGFAASTPTALLLAAGTKRAYTWIGPLEALARFEVPEGLEDAPGTIVVGDVVGLSNAQAQRASDEGDAYALTR
jgi:siroheme synthase